MSGQDRPAQATRADFAHFRPIATRWGDNDVYGHVNNVVYYSFFDTVVAGYHVETGLLDFETGPVIGLVVETGCRYFAPIAFPDRVEAGLRVAHLGRSSVRYEIGIFRGDETEASAQGHFVHVYVDRESRRPVPLPDNWREGLTKLLVPGRDETEASRSP
ncbi:acyl-CoA thioesterase [Methylobacterium sp. C25]|uniref:acyl-CoA thioesterase n=1 Tax=Methylobacterium sp. C25 TaxID=2721622 RepID=UPI001F16AC5E|nr:thioesterase family protein [Methylobacterium sp. C25]MCE4225748.1 acyl-CoA thioesterase [Methylobacterium sp. C25]